MKPLLWMVFAGLMGQAQAQLLSPETVDCRKVPSGPAQSACFRAQVEVEEESRESNAQSENRVQVPETTERVVSDWLELADYDAGDDVWDISEEAESTWLRCDEFNRNSATHQDLEIKVLKQRYPRGNYRAVGLQLEFVRQAKDNAIAASYLQEEFLRTLGAELDDGQLVPIVLRGYFRDGEDQGIDEAKERLQPGKAYRVNVEVRTVGVLAALHCLPRNANLEEDVRLFDEYYYW